MQGPKNTKISNPIRVQQEKAEKQRAMSRELKHSFILNTHRGES